MTRLAGWLLTQAAARMTGPLNAARVRRDRCSGADLELVGWRLLALIDAEEATLAARDRP